MLSNKLLASNLGCDLTFISSTKTNHLANTARTINVPTGVQSGDLIITIHSMGSDSANTITAQTGFTSLGLTETFPRHEVFHKVATAADTGTYSFTCSSSTTDSASVCICLRGTFNSIRAGTATTNDAGTSVDTPSTNTFGNAFVIGMFMRRITSTDTGTISTAPTDMTQIEYERTSGNEAALAVYYQRIINGTYTKSITFSTSPGSGFYNAARLLIVK